MYYCICSLRQHSGHNFKLNKMIMHFLIVLYYRYINGTLTQQAGPSSKLDDLVFNMEYLTDLSPGYEVKLL